MIYVRKREGYATYEANRAYYTPGLFLFQQKKRSTCACTYTDYSERSRVFLYTYAMLSIYSENQEVCEMMLRRLVVYCLHAKADIKLSRLSCQLSRRRECVWASIYPSPTRTYDGRRRHPPTPQKKKERATVSSSFLPSFLPPVKATPSIRKLFTPLATYITAAGKKGRKKKGRGRPLLHNKSSEELFSPSEIGGRGIASME